MDLREITDVISISVGAGVLSLLILATDEISIIVMMGLLLVTLTGFTSLIIHQLKIQKSYNYSILIAIINTVGVILGLLGFIFGEFNETMFSTAFVFQITIYSLFTLLIINSYYAFKLRKK